MTTIKCSCDDPFHSEPSYVDLTQLEYVTNNLIACIIDDVFKYDFWTLLPVTGDSTCNVCIYVGRNDDNGGVSHMEVSSNCSCLC